MAQGWKRIIFLVGAGCAMLVASMAGAARAKQRPADQRGEPQSSASADENAKEQLLDVWRSNTQGIIEMAETLPEEKYDLRPQLPAEMSNGERVPTFAELALAAAGMVSNFRAMLDGAKLPKGPPKREDFKNKADIVAFIKKAFAEGTVLLDNADLSKPVQGPKGPISGDQFWNDFVEGPANIHFALKSYYALMKWPLPPGEVAAASAASRIIPDRILRLTSECEKGKYASCTELGYLHTNTGGVEGETRAAGLYERGCEGGDGAGCYSRGLQYHFGHGAVQDEARAAVFFQRACDMGHVDGCDSLARLYDEGHGVAKDEARAAVLYQRACDGAKGMDCTVLGDMYFDGRGVNKDETRAAELYKRACDTGHGIPVIRGCFKLGIMYENGTGVKKDEARAAALYQRACDGDRRTGCEKLAAMYADGRGVAKDEPRAVALYRKACDAWSWTACGKVRNSPKYISIELRRVTVSEGLPLSPEFPSLVGIRLKSALNGTGFFEHVLDEGETPGATEVGQSLVLEVRIVDIKNTTLPDGSISGTGRVRLILRRLSDNKELINEELNERAPAWLNWSWNGDEKWLAQVLVTHILERLRAPLTLGAAR